MRGLPLRTAPSMPLPCRQPRKDAHLTENALTEWRIVGYTLHDDPAVRRGAFGRHVQIVVRPCSGGTRREPLRAADRRRVDASVIGGSAPGVASTATQTADLTRMTHRDRVRPEDFGGRSEAPRVARRRPHTRRRRPTRCRGPSCPSRFHPTPPRPLLRRCLPSSS
jgi:hypothetical protein